MRQLASVGAVTPLLWRQSAGAQGGPPAPTNIRLVEGLPPVSQAGNRQLLGGWRISQEFARGTIAIDFSRMKLWMAGHAQSNDILEYDLPAMGSGSDVNSWPVVTRTRTIGGWWPAAQGYCNGLVLWRNKLWAAPRVFYDTNPPSTMSIFAQDGETLTFQLPRQVFAGFVKRGPGADPLLGCGGYESGQGSSSGPSLATLSGQSLIRYGWPGDPGPVGSNGVPSNWNGRAPREPNYFPANHQDSWVAWEPRTINGELQGRWACDCIYGGGLVLPEGICYWAHMGTGDLDYARQRATFAADGAERTYVYTYDRNTYALLGYGQSQDVGPFISGQELGPDGKVYLAQGNAWSSGMYRVDVALKVFG